MQKRRMTRLAKRARAQASARTPKPEYVDKITPAHFSPNTLSLAVFGPGKGEAIVVRLPDGRLGVIDGCREPKEHRQGNGDPVRELLVAFAQHDGIPVQEQSLAFVCLTHPHDDHYAGLGWLMEAYRNRIQNLWMPAYSQRYLSDFLSYLDRMRDTTANLPDATDIKGLERVIEQQERLLKSAPPPQFETARGGLSVFRKRCCRHTLEITLCSPGGRDSHFALEHLIESIRNLLDDTRTTHYTAPDPNIISASLIIRWGQAKILLAGDLLCEHGGYQGWSEAARWIQGPVQVVNVAHHASSKAHHDELWAKMRPKIAIVTPFKHAVHDMPPRPEMLEQLAESGVTVAITAPPSWAPDEQERFAWTPPLDKKDVKKIPMRNSAITGYSAGGHDDRLNAVAVSLLHTGSIARLVLGGRARIVRPA